jgi:hypothetical protein
MFTVHATPKQAMIALGVALMWGEELKKHAPSEHGPRCFWGVPHAQAGLYHSARISERVRGITATLTK